MRKDKIYKIAQTKNNVTVFDFNKDGKNGYDIPEPHYEIINTKDQDWTFKKPADSKIDYLDMEKNPVPYDSTSTSQSDIGQQHVVINNDDDAKVEYRADHDLAQSTGVQKISIEVGNGNDESISGELKLFDPSSTTFVKHFLIRAQHYAYHNYSQDSYKAGYCNTTAAIDGVQFSMSSGNIDAGTFKLYGVK